MNLPPGILDQVRESLGLRGDPGAFSPVGGGDIHRAYAGRIGAERLFLKLNRVEAAPMFAAEFRGLHTLRKANALRVPEPYCHGADQEHAWLVMEFVELQRDGDHAALGAGLAGLHRVIANRHGATRDNFIGATPQPNRQHASWVDFWWHERLGYQLRLALREGDPGGLQARAERLHAALPGLLAGHEPAPSLLHGDLWGGNYGFDASGQGVLFDPACYHGDRETDLAMTELFGGFHPEFHRAYRANWPLDNGYAQRRPMYQLYHALNHLNLFGAAWLGRVTTLMNQLGI